MITLKEIEDKIKEFQVPHDAIFSTIPKKLSWGADEILNAVYVGKPPFEWEYYTPDFNYETYEKMCKLFAERDEVVCYMVTGRNYNHYWIKLICDESFKTEIDLAGGLENWIEIGG